MTTFNLGGATFQSGINMPSFGKASGSSGLKIPNLGSVSSNVGIDLSKGVNGLTGDIKLTKDKGNVFRSGATDSETVNDISHQAVCSYFIGPQAENMKFFRKNMDEILNQLEKSRVNYFPDDGVSLHHLYSLLEDSAEISNSISFSAGFHNRADPELSRVPGPDHGRRQCHSEDRRVTGKTLNPVLVPSLPSAHVQ